MPEILGYNPGKVMQTCLLSQFYKLEVKVWARLVPPDSVDEDLLPVSPHKAFPLCSSFFLCPNFPFAQGHQSR